MPQEKIPVSTALAPRAAAEGNFGLHPFAAHAGVGENYKKPVMDSDGFVDQIVDLLAALDVMGREPATDSFMLEISVEPVGEILVL